MSGSWQLDEEVHKPRERSWDADTIQRALEELPLEVCALDLGGLALTPDHLRWLGRWEGMERLEILWLGHTSATLEHLRALTSGHIPHELYRLELSGAQIASVEEELFELLNERMPALEHLELSFIESMPGQALTRLRQLAVLDLTFTTLEPNAFHFLSHNSQQTLLEELHVACTGPFTTYQSLLTLLKSRRVGRLSVLDARGCNLGRYQEMTRLSEGDLGYFFELEEFWMEGNLITRAELDQLKAAAGESAQEIESRMRPYLLSSKKIQNERYSRERALSEVDIRDLTPTRLQDYLKIAALSPGDIDAIARWFELHP